MYYPNCIHEQHQTSNTYNHQAANLHGDIFDNILYHVNAVEGDITDFTKYLAYVLKSPK